MKQASITLAGRALAAALMFTLASGPVLVTVQHSIERCQSSATPSQTCALALSWLTRAISDAATSPAISAAMVEGE